MICKCKVCVYWSRIKIGCRNHSRRDDWKAQMLHQVSDQSYTCPSWYPEDDDWEVEDE